MAKLDREEFLRKVEATPIVEPDQWDIKMLSEIDEEANDNTTVTLDELRARRECNGKISVKVPKELH